MGKNKLEVLLFFYDQSRKEVFLRHDFLHKTLAFNLVGAITLVSFAIENPSLFFLVPVFTSFGTILYLYNLGAKSIQAAYCRTLEFEIEAESPGLSIPLPEAAAGTFMVGRAQTRNYSGIWAMRSLLLPILTALSLAAYLTAGVLNPLNFCTVTVFVVMDCLALFAYIRLEKRNTEVIRSAAQRTTAQRHRGGVFSGESLVVR